MSINETAVQQYTRGVISAIVDGGGKRGNPPPRTKLFFLYDMGSISRQTYLTVRRLI